MLTGPNGLLTQAGEAKTNTEEAGAREKVEIAVASSYGENGFDVEKLKTEVERFGGTVTENPLVVEMGDYEATLDETTGEIKTFESSKGVRPQVSAKLYQENGAALKEGTSYEKVVLTIVIENEDELGKINEVKVVDSTGATIEKEATVIGDGYASYKVKGEGKVSITVKATTEGVEKETTIEVAIVVAPEYWETTSKTDKNWYSYGGVKVNAPKLKGNMTPIKYTGEIAETEPTANNKWANAITTDGSMWVWIPRYAYKITKGYHKTITETTEGEILIAFVDTKNKLLNGESGAITDDPSKVTYTEDGVQEQWLVHPAFTSNAENGGGFGEIEGLWVGKFEATGTYDSESKTGTLSVKPGQKSLSEMTINEQYRLAKSSTFGESVTAEQLGSHMAKNSEWGAVAYLGHSQYGTKGEIVEKNEDRTYHSTGGSTFKKTIYTNNKKQSTTHNATGVYDMNGGSWEYVASYVNNGNESLTTYGGDQDGDLCDNTGTKRGESTAYKTVYAQGSSDDKLANREANAGKKGDAVYETSYYTGVLSASWFREYGTYPCSNKTFLIVELVRKIVTRVLSLSVMTTVMVGTGIHSVHCWSAEALNVTLYLVLFWAVKIW